ncbi:MAG: hypothetical protein AAB373_05280 [Patescibacteria group bacterium]
MSQAAHKPTGGPDDETGKSKLEVVKPGDAFRDANLGFVNDLYRIAEAKKQDKKELFIDFEDKEVTKIIDDDTRARIEQNLGNHVEFFQQAFKKEKKDIKEGPDAETKRVAAFKRAFEAIYGKFLMEKPSEHLLGKLGKALKGKLKFPIGDEGFNGKTELLSAAARLQRELLHKDAHENPIKEAAIAPAKKKKEIAVAHKAKAQHELAVVEKYKGVVDRDANYKALNELRKEVNADSRNSAERKRLQGQIDNPDTSQLKGRLHDSLGEVFSGVTGMREWINNRIPRVQKEIGKKKAKTIVDLLENADLSSLIRGLDGSTGAIAFDFGEGMLRETGTFDLDSYYQSIDNFIAIFETNLSKKEIGKLGPLAGNIATLKGQVEALKTNNVINNSLSEIQNYPQKLRDDLYTLERESGDVDGRLTAHRKNVRDGVQKLADGVDAMLQDGELLGSIPNLEVRCQEFMTKLQELFVKLASLKSYRPFEAAYREFFDDAYAPIADLLGQAKHHAEHDIGHADHEIHDADAELKAAGGGGHGSILVSAHHKAVGAAEKAKNEKGAEVTAKEQQIASKIGELKTDQIGEIKVEIATVGSKIEKLETGISNKAAFAKELEFLTNGLNEIVNLLSAGESVLRQEIGNEGIVLYPDGRFDLSKYQPAKDLEVIKERIEESERTKERLNVELGGLAVLSEGPKGEQEIDLTPKIEELQGSISEVDSEIISLKGEEAKSEAAIKSRTSSITSLLENYQKIQVSKRTVESKIEKLTTDSGNLEDELKKSGVDYFDDLKSALTQLQENLGSFQSADLETAKGIDILEKDLAELKKQHGDLEAKHTEVKGMDVEDWILHEAFKGKHDSVALERFKRGVKDAEGEKHDVDHVKDYFADSKGLSKLMDDIGKYSTDAVMGQSVLEEDDELKAQVGNISKMAFNRRISMIESMIDTKKLSIYSKQDIANMTKNVQGAQKTTDVEKYTKENEKTTRQMALLNDELKMYKAVQKQATDLVTGITKLLESAKEAEHLGIKFEGFHYPAAAGHGEHHGSFDAILTALKAINPEGRTFEPGHLTAISNAIKAYFIPSNVEKLKGQFDVKLAAVEKSVKAAKDNLDEAEKENTVKLTDAQAGKKVYEQILKRYAEEGVFGAKGLPSIERGMLATAEMVNDVHLVQGGMSYEGLAKLGSAELLDTVNEAGFRARLIEFTYNMPDGKVIKPFKGMQPKDFKDADAIERKFNLGKLGYQNGFFALAAFEVMDEEKASGKAPGHGHGHGAANENKEHDAPGGHGHKPEFAPASGQTNILRAKLRKLVAKRMGVEKRLDDAGIATVVDDFCRDQLAAIKPRVQEFFEEADHHGTGWKEAQIKIFKNKRKKLMIRKRNGNLDKVRFKIAMAHLKHDAEEAGVAAEVGFSQAGVLNWFWESKGGDEMEKFGRNVGHWAAGKGIGVLKQGGMMGLKGAWGAAKLATKLSLRGSWTLMRSPFQVAARTAIGAANLASKKKFKNVPGVIESLKKDVAKVTGDVVDTAKGTWKTVSEAPGKAWNERAWDGNAANRILAEKLSKLEAANTDLEHEAEPHGVDVGGSPYLSFEPYLHRIAELNKLTGYVPSSFDSGTPSEDGKGVEVVGTAKKHHGDHGDDHGAADHGKKANGHDTHKKAA